MVKKIEPAGPSWARGKVSPFGRTNGHAGALYRETLVDPGKDEHRDALARASQKSISTIMQRFGMTAMTPAPGGKEEIDSPLTDSWVIYACIDAISEAVRSVPLVVRPTDDPKAEPLSNGDAIVDLFDHPHKGMSWSEMVEADAIHRRLSGESFWFLMDQDGEPVAMVGEGRSALIDLPVQIVPVNGGAVADQRDVDGAVETWAYMLAGRSATSNRFPWASVLQFRNYNPMDPERGLGQTHVALRPANVAFQGERYQEAVLRSGGPGAYLAFKKEQFNEADERRLQDKIDEANRNPDRIGGLQLITGDVEIVANPATPKEMLTKEIQAWYRDVVCSIYGVPPPVIGIFENATYNNISEAYRQFWNRIKTYLDSVADTLNNRFFPRLKDGKLSRYRVSFDYSAVPHLREDEKDKIVAASEIAAKRIGLSFNAAARLLGVRAELPVEGEVVLEPITSNPDEDVDDDPKDDEKQLRRRGPRARRRMRTPRLATEPERREYVQSLHARVTSPREMRIGRRTLAWLRNYERAYVARLREFAVTGKSARAGVQRSPTPQDEIERLLVLSETVWADKLRRAVEAQIEAAYLDALADAAAELGVVQMDATDPRILRLIDTQISKLTEGVTATVTRRVKDALITGLVDGTSQASLQARVLEVLPELTDELRRVFGNKEARAATIARTETNKAVSNARIQQMLDAGVQEIQWLSSRDGHVRDSHVGLDGQTRPIGEEFKPSLRWPDDENGPPEEVINCRCVPKPVVEA